MGLSKEMLSPKETRPAFSNTSLGSSEIKVNKFPARNDRSESRIAELLSIILGEKDKVKHAEEPKLKREHGFEPFVNPQPLEDTLFVNGYNGNFSQKMDLNRNGVERVLKIAHLEGQVFLTTLSLNRQRSTEANPDGSVSAKRFLLYEEKAKKDEKASPLSRVVAVPQGWKIEIDDTKITEGLNEKKLTGEKLQTTFIKNFNQLLKDSLFECIRKEKMTGIKDMHFRDKALLSVISPGAGLFFWVPIWASKFAPLDLTTIAFYISGIFNAYAICNLFELIRKRKIEYLQGALRTLDPKYNTNYSAYIGRRLDAPWEYLMPPVEIDKVLRSFLSLKARTLVKEKKPEIK